MYIRFLFFLFLLGYSTHSTISGQNIDAFVNSYESRYIVSDNSLTKKVSISITIFNQNGEDLTHFYIPYSKNNSLNYLKASIEDINGNEIRELSKKEIETYSTSSEISFFEDEYTKYFELRHNKYPYVVNCVYEIWSNDFISITHWTPAYRYNFPTLSASLSITVPKNYSINTRSNNIEKCDTIKDADKITYNWKSNYPAQVALELYAPPKEVTQPYVIAVPRTFNYGINGSQNTWEDFGNWQYNLINNLDILPESEKIKIDTIIKNKTNQLQVMEALYKYLQENTRYINVKLGVGGLKPYPASYVVRNKYGDCKALTIYMKAMLKYAGINSYYTKIFAGDRIRPVDTSFPSQQFNHVLLCSTIETDTIFIECTSKNEPLGYISSFSQNRNAFIIDSNNSRFVKTPGLTIKDVLNSSTYIVDLNSMGNSSTECVIKVKGNEFEKLNNLLKVYSEKDLDEFLRNYLPIEQYSLNSWEINDTNNYEAIELKLNIGVNNLIKQYGEDHLLTIFPLHIPEFEKPANRKHPVWIDYPIAIHDSIIYKHPQNLQLNKKSEDVELESKYGNYSVNFIAEENRTIVVRELNLKPGRYNLNEYPDFYNFIFHIKNTERKNAILYKE